MKENAGKRGKKKMDERQEEREKEGGEVEERAEERTEEGIEEREERSEVTEEAKNMRGARKMSSTQPREPGSVQHSLTAKKLQLWSL